MNLIEDNTATQMPIERNMPGYKHKPYRSNGPSNLFKPGIKRRIEAAGTTFVPRTYLETQDAV